jgi:hypothetical protein
MSNPFFLAVNSEAEELADFFLEIQEHVGIEGVDRQDGVFGFLALLFRSLRVFNCQVGVGDNIGLGDFSIARQRYRLRGEVRNEIGQDQGEQEQVQKGAACQLLPEAHLVFFRRLGRPLFSFMRRGGAFEKLEVFERYQAHGYARALASAFW